MIAEMTRGGICGGIGEIAACTQPVQPASVPEPLVVVRSHDPRLPYDRYELAALLTAMLERVEIEPGTRMELECMHDGTMATLNAQAMDCPGPTNVLAFPDGADAFLGSLALSVDTLEREAILYGLSCAQHCRCLLAHGLAHLLGYEHGPEMDELCHELGKVSPI